MPTNFHKVINNAIGYLASAIDNNDLSFTLGTGEGAVFDVSGLFWVSIESEILDCSGVSGNTITVVSRGSQDTIATSHDAGTAVELLITAGQMQEMQDAINNFENAGTDPDFNTVDVGGGYGSTGLSADNSGNLNMNGNLTVDGTSTLTGNVLASGSISIGGGYGSTGTTISNSGNIQTNGTITVDGTITAGSGAHVLTSSAGLINAAKIDSSTNLSVSNLTATGKVSFPLTSATISAGAITATGSYMVIDTEGAAATDDLETINGGVDGMVLALVSANGSRDIVVKNNVGNIRCASDFTINTTSDVSFLNFRSGSGWKRISNSNN